MEKWGNIFIWNHCTGVTKTCLVCFSRTHLRIFPCWPLFFMLKSSRKFGSLLLFSKFLFFFLPLFSSLSISYPQIIVFVSEHGIPFKCTLWKVSLRAASFSTGRPASPVNFFWLVMFYLMIIFQLPFLSQYLSPISHIFMLFETRMKVENSYRMRDGLSLTLLHNHWNKKIFLAKLLLSYIEITRKTWVCS